MKGVIIRGYDMNTLVDTGIRQFPLNRQQGSRWMITNIAGIRNFGPRRIKGRQHIRGAILLMDMPGQKANGVFEFRIINGDNLDQRRPPETR